MTMSVQGFAPMPARARPRINAGHPRLAETAKFVSWEQGLTGKENSPP